jgi:hypothetical protein
MSGPRALTRYDTSLKPPRLSSKSRQEPAQHTNVYIEMLHSQICAGVEPAASGGDSVGCAVVS